LKRYIARQIYKTLTRQNTTNPGIPQAA